MYQINDYFLIQDMGINQQKQTDFNDDKDSIFDDCKAKFDKDFNILAIL